MAVVLRVDDDPDNHTLFFAWLSWMNHRVLGARSASEALQVLDEHGVPDVIVVDIVMEHIDGLQLLDHLRRHRPEGADLPAILLTARHLHTDQIIARDLNPNC